MPYLFDRAQTFLIPARFELASQDSKSYVLTATPWGRGGLHPSPDGVGRGTRAAVRAYSGSGIITIAPDGHSATQIPQPLQYVSETVNSPSG